MGNLKHIDQAIAPRIRILMKGEPLGGKKVSFLILYDENRSKIVRSLIKR